MCRSMGKFVVFDDHESSNHGIESCIIQDEVGNGAMALLIGSVGWLKNEDRLGEKKDSARVEERMCRE